MKASAKAALTLSLLFLTVWSSSPAHADPKKWPKQPPDSASWNDYHKWLYSIPLEYRPVMMTQPSTGGMFVDRDKHISITGNSMADYDDGSTRLFFLLHSSDQSREVIWGPTSEISDWFSLISHRLLGCFKPAVAGRMRADVVFGVNHVRSIQIYDLGNAAPFELTTAEWKRIANPVPFKESVVKALNDLMKNPENRLPPHVVAVKLKFVFQKNRIRDQGEPEPVFLRMPDKVRKDRARMSPAARRGEINPEDDPQWQSHQKRLPP